MWLRACVGAVLFSGCVTTIAQGLPMTEHPASVPWCGDGPRKIPPTLARPDPTNPIIPASILEPCTSLILGKHWKDWALNNEAWRGSVIFGLTTNHLGELTDVCVWGGNFGNPTRWVECVVETIRTGHLILPGESGQHEWTLTFVMD